MSVFHEIGLTSFTFIFHCAFELRPCYTSAGAAFEGVTQYAYQLPSVLISLFYSYNCQLALVSADMNF